MEIGAVTHLWQVICPVLIKWISICQWNFVLFDIFFYHLVIVKKKYTLTYANSVNPDQAASDTSLHCKPI